MADSDFLHLQRSFKLLPAVTGVLPDSRATSELDGQLGERVDGQSGCEGVEASACAHGGDSEAEAGCEGVVAVNFARCFILSDRFDIFYSEGMATIAAAADYLDRHREFEHLARERGEHRNGILFSRYSIILSQLLLCMMDWLNRRRKWQAEAERSGIEPPVGIDRDVLSAKAPELFPALKLHPFLDRATPSYPLPAVLPRGLVDHIYQAGILHRRMTMLEAGFRREGVLSGEVSGEVSDAVGVRGDEGGGQRVELVVLPTVPTLGG